MRLFILTLVVVAAGCATAKTEPATVVPLRAAEAPLAQAKLELARQACKMAGELLRSNQIDLAAVARWSVRLRDAEMGVAADKAGRVAAAASGVERMKQHEADGQALYDNGRITFIAVLEFRYKRMEAEEVLAKAKAE